MLVNRLCVINKKLSLPMRFEFSQKTWEYMPKHWNLKNTKQEKRMLHGKQMNFFPKYAFNFNDTLNIPGITDDKDTLCNIYEEFVINKESPMSQQFVALMLYNFSKNDFLNKFTWAKLQPYIGRNRGEYSQRSIFGCFYACIRYGREDYIQFFIDEMVGQKLTFTDIEAVQIIQAFNASKHPYSLQYKHQFWQRHFKRYYMNLIDEKIRIKKISNALRIFDAFYKFEYFQDEELWNNILSWLERRKGWIRTDIIERIYPLTGTFPKAKEMFDAYYAELSVNPHIKWRYNLEQFRLYTSEEMIAKSQLNIEMKPADRTIVQRKDQAQMNAEYQEWLKDGARQKQSELVKDKAQSLAYAIKNRYESLKADNKVDFSTISIEQFNDLFGGYDPQLIYQQKSPSQTSGIFGQIKDSSGSQRSKYGQQEQQQVKKKEKPKQKQKKSKKK